MQQTIVINHSYHFETVLSIIENTSLSCQLYSASSVPEVIDLIKRVPNVIGVLSIEHLLTTKSLAEYTQLIKTMDEISEAQGKPLVLSLLYNSKHMLPILDRISSKYIDIMGFKYPYITEEIVRLDGIMPIIAKRNGVIAKTDVVDFEMTAETKLIESSATLIESLVYVLSDTEPEALEQVIKNYPIAETIYQIKMGLEPNISKISKDDYIQYFIEAARKIGGNKQ